MNLLNLYIYQCIYFIYLQVRTLRGTVLLQITKSGHDEAARQLGCALHLLAVLFKHIEEL